MIKLSIAVGFIATLAAGLSLAPTAGALEQPNGAPIPTQPGCNGGQPTGLAAEFACVCTQPNICNIGDPCPSQNNCPNGQNGECEATMWHSFNDNTCIPSNLSGLDPYAEAAVIPETFHPTCPQTFSLISRGTAMFQDAFGWYNVTSAEPALSDLHVMLSCSATAGTEVVLDLQSEPDYQGGDIGFFIITPESLQAPGSCANGDCCATVARVGSGEGHVYYSERDYNPDFEGVDSYIHLITYGSHVWDNKFYFAWEDIYGGSNNDFTDLLTGVSGLHCSGGGQPCETGQEGICGRGITECQQSELVCEPVFEAVAELCNALDDDCNGAIDDDASCEVEGHICHQGSCLPPCNSGEFPCIGNTVCDQQNGLCVHPDCVGADCADGTICREGSCVEPCEGVHCPHGQHCFADKCLDLCAGVLCPQGDVCIEGLCLAGCTECDGITCEHPLECNQVEGDCVDPSCPDGCPEGTYCDGGECKDACDGAICPGGEPCVNGQCGGTSEGGGGAGGNQLPNPGGNGGTNGSLDQAEGGPSCLCRVGLPSRGGATALALLGLGLLVAARRARRR